MTFPQAAAKYNCNPNYLRVAANRGDLKAKKIGRDWTVTDSEMNRFLNRKTKKPSD